MRRKLASVMMIHVVVLMALCAGAPHATACFYTDPNLHAVYNPATGGLHFENVNELLGLRINAPGLLVAGQATDLGGAAAGTFGGVTDLAPDFIEWGNLLGMTFEREFAGNIYEPGTPFDVVVENSFFRFFVDASPGVDFCGVFVLIPEPTGLVLSSFALACLMLRRWRV